VADRTRTYDLWVRNPTLYPLSYGHVHTDYTIGLQDLQGKRGQESGTAPPASRRGCVVRELAGQLEQPNQLTPDLIEEAEELLAGEAHYEDHHDHDEHED
jgi:hypothetical protein